MEYANRIASFLIPGCDSMPQGEYSRVLPTVYRTSVTVLIYPCVRKALGLKENYKKLFITRDPPLTPEEYIHEYVMILAYNETLKKSRGE